MERVPSIAEALAQFEMDRELAGSSVASIASYRCRLRPLLDEIELTPAVCRQLIASDLRRNSASTARMCAAALSAFGIYCVGQGWLAVNPMRDVPRPKATVHAHRYLSVEELRRVWAAPMRADLRLTVVLLMLGLRAGELVALDWRDVNWRERTIFVKTEKGGPPRTLPLDDLTLGLLIEAKGEGRIIPCTTANVRERLKRLGRRAGVRLHPHCFRHTMASQWLLAGGGELALQALGGWTSLLMPRSYSRSVQQDVALRAAREMRLTERLLGTDGTIGSTRA